MSDASGSQGVVLKMGTNGSPASLATISEMINVSGPTPTAEEIDVTHLGTVGSYREFLASFKNAGEISADGNLIAAHLTTVVTAFDDQVERDFTLAFPLTGGTKTASFGGFVKSYNVSAGVGSQNKIALTIKISGAVTWA